jgi:hypothetical protein
MLQCVRDGVRVSGGLLSISPAERIRRGSWIALDSVARYRRLLRSAVTGLVLMASASCLPDGGEADGEPPADAIPVDDAVAVDGVRYELQGCRMRTVRNGIVLAELELVMQGDCGFVRERSGRLQQLATETGTAALVTTSTPNDNDRFCTTVIRAVRLDPHRPAVSRDEQRIESCSAGPFDEKMLIVLSQSIPAEDS